MVVSTSKSYPTPLSKPSSIITWSCSAPIHWGLIWPCCLVESRPRVCLFCYMTCSSAGSPPTSCVFCKVASLHMAICPKPYSILWVLLYLPDNLLLVDASIVRQLKTRDQVAVIFPVLINWMEQGESWVGQVLEQHHGWQEMNQNNNTNNESALTRWSKRRKSVGLHEHNNDERKINDEKGTPVSLQKGAGRLKFH